MPGLVARALGLVWLCALPVAFATAQSYPDRPLRWITAAAPGGPPDVVARIVAERLAAALGQPVVVENRPGAGGTIGVAEALKAPADGYTLTTMFLPVAIAQTLYPKRFELTSDFTPVAHLVWQYNLLVVPPVPRVETVAELVESLKRRPGQPFASAGSGTPSHIAGELFRQRAGVDVVHVPYKTLPQALTDLLGGQVSFVFASMAAAVPHVQAGRLKALAITAPARNPALPDVPTMVESGFPDLQIRDWQGVMVRAGTPPAIVERLNREIARILAMPDVGERLRALGADPYTGTPAAFGRFVADEVERWGRFVTQAGIRLE